MARYEKRYERSPRSNVWLPSVINTNIANVEDGKCYQLGCAPSQSADSLVDYQESTLVRTRGSFMWQVGTSNTRPVGWIYAQVLPSQLFDAANNGKEATILSAPVDVQATDDFPIIEPACLPIASRGTSPQEIVIDSKAKRKVGKDKLIVFGLCIFGVLASGSSYPVKVVGALRCLFSLLR